MSQQTPLKLANSYVPTNYSSTDTVPPTNIAPSPTDGQVLTADSTLTAGMKWAASSASISDASVGVVPADIEIQAQRVTLNRPVPLWYPLERVYTSRSFF